MRLNERPRSAGVLQTTPARSEKVSSSLTVCSSGAAALSAAEHGIQEDAGLHGYPLAGPMLKDHWLPQRDLMGLPVLRKVTWTSVYIPLAKASHMAKPTKGSRGR